MIIRRYSRRDQKEVWDLHLRTVAAAGFPQSVAEADTDLHGIGANYLNSGGDFVVIADDNRIIAMGGYQNMEHFCAELKRMRVHPDWQRRASAKNF